MCQHFGVLPLSERLWLLNLLCEKQRKIKVEGLGEKKKGDSDREKERDLLLIVFVETSLDILKKGNIGVTLCVHVYVFCRLKTATKNISMKTGNLNLATC